MKPVIKMIAQLFLAVLLCCVSVVAQEFTVKFASVAPEGSTWLNVMREYDAAIRTESNGRLGFKIYPGGVQGEDKDVLRKIRLGQLHSAGLTGFGLGEIAPKLRILDAPFLFENYDEVDHVYATLDQEFKQALEENNYVLLGWAEVGFVHILTNTPVRTPADMNGVKMWMWEGDPIAEATFKSFGITPIPLSLTDVLTSLQTGLINGVYTSPLAALVLQWHTRVKYMLDIPLADASGAVVISQKMFNSLPADLQEILVRNGKKYLTALTRKSREENAKAIDVMKKSGVEIITVTSDRTMQEYRQAGKQTREALIGKMYDRSFLDRVEKAVTEFRSAAPSRK